MNETLTAYKINAYSNTLELVSMSHDFEEINKQIGCHTFTIGKVLKNGDVLYVDDEGFLNEKVTRGFLFDEDFFAGNGIIMGSDNEGNSCSAKSLAGDTSVRVTFTHEGLEITDKMRDDACKWAITSY